MKRINTFIPHILIIIGFMVMAFIYAKPVLDKKVLEQHDILQAKGAAHEIVNYEKETGEYSLWTNSMFSGMPSYTVVGKYPNSWTSNLAGYITYLFPDPVNVIFFLLAGFYIMMAVLGFNPWISAMGAFAFAFSSFNFISLEAGHVSKVLAIAFAPPLIAGVILLFRGKYFIGGVVTLIFTFMELYANHVQITYYVFIALLLYAVFELVISIKEKRIKQYLIASALLVVIAGISVASMASRFWTMYEYSKYTTRGASELKSNTESKGGLDKDYAFFHSYGIGETFTFLIPNFKGGGSQGNLDASSNVYKVVKKAYGAQAAKGFIENPLPLYWGNQPNTAGPAYIGAIVCFLFVLGLFIIKNPLKWWISGVVLLFIMLSWGANNPVLSDFFFYNIPLYNKFRGVTMIHAIVAIFMSFLAVWCVKSLVEKGIENKTSINYLKYVTIAFGGFLLIMVLMGDAFLSFEKEQKNDEQTSDQYFLSNLERMTNDKAIAGEIFDAMVLDRASLMKMDSLRSLVFILMSAILIWLFLKKKIQPEILYAGLIVLILVDMWPVCKRYLNNDDFESRKKYQANFEPSEADQMILEDKDPHFRVMNTTVSTFNDATTSYFHKSIGGYSAAKMRRYQEVIEKHISENNRAVLDMLNTKYVIQQTQDGKVYPFRNGSALGNAWFVNAYKWVRNPDEEIDALKGLRPDSIAIIDNIFKDKVGNLVISPDSSASIKLTQYKPDQLTYESVTGSDQLAVFSEVYYDNGLGWESYIDGKPVSHFRVNYILRAMVVPAGKHKIEFKFHPQSYFTGEKISLICSLLVFGSIIGLTFIKIKKNKVEDMDL